MSKHKRRRLPKLSYTDSQNIGYYATFRDPVSDTPRRKRFGMIPAGEAQKLYTKWLVKHVGGEVDKPKVGITPEPLPPAPVVLSHEVSQPMAPGCMLAGANNWLRFEEARTRTEGEPKRVGTITHRVYLDRAKLLQNFLRHLTERHGQGTLARMSLVDLSMEDVESYNQQIVRAGYSASQVAKRMQVVKAVINRAGRPELGQQVLPWNWDSMDRQHGKPTEKRDLPTLPQLKAVLNATDERGRALIWMAIGLGFGQRDLAAVRATGHIDQTSYDLRRGKTGIERYGETPPLVWGSIEVYLKSHPRDPGQLMFTTRTGLPIVHGRSDSIVQWWCGQREKIGETKATLSGFYVLRHLGATEYGSREGTSIVAMKRWLGHAAGSDMADMYMKPITPEQRGMIEWTRQSLASGHADTSASASGTAY